jgi:hypothetical protein
MNTPSSPKFRTDQSKVQKFDEFEQNIEQEYDDLKKIYRNFVNNDDQIYQLPNRGSDKSRFDKIKNKIDTNISRSEIEDRIRSIEKDNPSIKDRMHKYRLTNDPDVQSFESISSKNVDSYKLFSDIESIYNNSKKISKMANSDEFKNSSQWNEWVENDILSTKENLERISNWMKSQVR